MILSSNSITKDKNPRKIISEFSSDSNFLGLSQLVKTKYKFLYIFLLLLLICSNFYVNISSIMDYLRYDIIPSTNIYKQVPMAFPMITICNMNSYVSYRKFSMKQMLLDCQVGLRKCNASDFSKKFRISTYHCYSLNDGVNKSIMKTSINGHLYGISLKLYAGMPSEARLYINGFLVFINNQTEFPLTEQAEQVSGGFYTRLKVN